MPAGFTYDGRTRLFILSADPASLDAPTLTEIHAGVDLSGYLVPESFNPGTGNSRVETRDALTSFDSQAAGRHQSAPTCEFKSKLADTGGELAWTTLGRRLVQGCLVFFEDIPEGEAVDAGDSCDVYPSFQTGAPRRLQTAINTERRFGVDFMIGDAPHLGVLVGGS